MEELEDEGGQKLGTIPKEKKLVFYCQIGRKSLELDEYNALEDRECYSLEGGYMAYIRSGLKEETDTGEKQKKQKRALGRSSISSCFHRLRGPARHISW
jgi:hypothetical protein